MRISVYKASPTLLHLGLFLRERFPLSGNSVSVWGFSSFDNLLSEKEVLTCIPNNKIQGGPFHYILK